MAKVLLIVGVPGSGKTTNLEVLNQDGWLTFDDFKAKARSASFSDSLHFENLLTKLRKVNDVRLPISIFAKAILKLMRNRLYGQRYKMSKYSHGSLRITTERVR